MKARAPGGRPPAALVGRGRELAALSELIGDVAEGHGRAVLIEGEAGSGKTTLLASAINRARRLAIFHAVGREIDRARPFGLIIDALGISLNSDDSQRRSIARDLRAGSKQLGDAWRYRVTEDVVALVEREALAGPVLLLLDDAQWADDASVVAIHHLARRTTFLPVGLIVARRPPVGRGGGADHLGDLKLDARTDRIELEPLDEENVAALARSILGVPPAAGLRALLSKAGGNPFFVGELLAALQEERSIDVHGSEADVSITGLRPDLRMVILQRLRGLGAAAIRALRVASVLGVTFSPRDLALALASPTPEVLDLLEEAIAADVLRTHGDELTFRHDLVREALYNDVPPPIRNELHMEVARALRRAGASASRCAAHFAIGAAARDDDAIECLRAAAGELSTTEPKAAYRWLARALELLPSSDDRHDEIVAETLTLLITIGDAPTAEAKAREALSRPQPPLRRIRLRRGLADAVDYQDRCLEAAGIAASETRARDIDAIERIRFAAQAVEYRVHVEPVEVEQNARDVLRRAEELGDEAAIRRTVSALYHIAFWRADFDAAIALAERLATPSSPDDRISITDGFLGRVLVRAGRTREALESLRAELRINESQGEAARTVAVLRELASIEAQQGRWDEAISDGEAAIALADEFGNAALHDAAAGQVALLLVRRDEIDRAAALLAGLRDKRRFMAVLSEARLAEARHGAAAGLEILRDTWRLARSTGRLFDLPQYAPDLVRLEVELDDVADAVEVTDSVERLADPIGAGWIRVAALRCRGLLDIDATPALAALALAREKELDDDAASAAEEAGRLLGGAGRREDAIAALNEALAYYTLVGALRDERRIDAMLRGLGVRRGRRGRHAREQTGWGSLTETEQRVAQLAASGLTNSQIGKRLYISGRTVDRHLTHVYAKLGVSSRVELAVQAAAASARP